MSERAIGAVNMKLHDVGDFWTVADDFRKRGAPWIPRAGYELRRPIEVAGKVWRATLNIHVLGETTNGVAEGDVGVRFESCVMLWPPTLTAAEEQRLARLGWYANAKRVLEREGYKGGWKKGPAGKWGNFTKELESIGVVKREAAALEGLDLAVPDLSSGAKARSQPRTGARKRSRQSRR